jgi:hypothetical protein
VLLAKLLSSIIRMIKSNTKIWAGQVTLMGEKCIHNSGRKTCKKEPLVSSMRRWEDVIKMDLREREWKGVRWIYLARTGTNGGRL